MADPASPLQLPVMPTSRPLGVNQNPTTPAAPGLVAGVGKFMTQPFTGNAPVGAAAPAPTVAQVTTPAANPYLTNGSIPPIASPAAVAAFYKTAPLPAAQVAGAAAPGPVAPIDPLANKIHFVDQNSPRVVASQAAPTIVRDGVTSAPPAVGGGMTNRQMAAMMPLLAPQQQPTTRASHDLLDSYQKQFHDEIEAASTSSDPRQAQVLKSQALVNHQLRLLNFLKGMPGLTGNTLVQQQEGQQ